jgi:hypothetical protein
LLCKTKKAGFAPVEVILGRVRKLPKRPKVAAFFLPLETKGQRRKKKFSELYQAKKKMKIRG